MPASSESTCRPTVAAPAFCDRAASVQAAGPGHREEVLEIIQSMAFQN